MANPNPKASLTACDLTDVTFQSCVLSHISLENCTLHSVTFVDCDLDWSYFSAGTFENITLRQCRLEGAIITDLTFINPAFSDNKTTDTYEVQVSNVSLQDPKGTRTVSSLEALMEI